jgi:hypothetical protein
VTDELVDLIAWARGHWDEPPTRMHSAGVEPESELGAPRWDERFRRWMIGVGKDGGPFAKSNFEESIRRCSNHQRDEGDEERASCSICQGTMRVTLSRGIYRWPMRAALAELGLVVVPKVIPTYDRVVWLLANNRWSLDALSSVTASRYPVMGEPVFASHIALLALRQCKRKYREAGRWKPVRDKSQAQINAEAA